MKNFSSDEYWDSVNGDFVFKKPAGNNPLVIFIKKNFKPDRTQSVFEIGCFPGTYLSIFGDLGYALNGIDISLRTRTDMRGWLVSNGYTCGELVSGDIFAFSTKTKYDVVCSFGFIEHFDEFNALVLKHADFLKPHGKVLITAPNFKGFIQHAFHGYFDKANLLKHNVDSMDPRLWAKTLEGAGFKILYSGWFGNIDLWAEKEDRGIAKAVLLKAIFQAMKVLRMIPIANCRAYSPYCGVIAEKI